MESTARHSALAPRKHGVMAGDTYYQVLAASTPLLWSFWLCVPGACCKPVAPECGSVPPNAAHCCSCLSCIAATAACWTNRYFFHALQFALPVLFSLTCCHLHANTTKKKRKHHRQRPALVCIVVMWQPVPTQHLAPACSRQMTWYLNRRFLAMAGWRPVCCCA